jgi:hypothetical protein
MVFSNKLETVIDECLTSLLDLGLTACLTRLALLAPP